MTNPDFSTYTDAELIRARRETVSLGGSDAELREARDEYLALDGEPELKSYLRETAELIDIELARRAETRKRWPDAYLDD